MRLLSHIAHEVPRLAATVGDLADGLAERSLVPAGDEDAGASRRQLEDDGAPDALASSGDEGHLAVEQARHRHGISP